MAKTLFLSLILVLPLATVGLSRTARGGPSNLPIVGLWSPKYQTSNVTTTSISPGSTIMFDINVTNAPVFNAFELSLFYDPRVLTEISLQVANVTLFANPFIVSQRVESLSYPDPYLLGGVNRVERIQLVVVNLGSVPPPIGSGVLAKISFTTGSGATPLTLAASSSAPSSFSQDLTLLAFGSNPIQVSTSDGYFNNENVGVGPIAEFSTHSIVPGELGFSFDGAGSYDPDNPNGPNRGISKWVWDFGDGSNATTITPYVSHTYRPITGAIVWGNLSARLTVFDTDGSLGISALIVAVPNLCPPGLSVAKVPTQCPTIMSAINAIVLGGTVQLDAGNYSETLYITKPLRLIGAGPQLTIINSTSDIAVTISANNVSVSGLKVANGYQPYQPNPKGYLAALSLEHSNHTSVSNSIFVSGHIPFNQLGPDYGIFLSHTRNAELTGNLVENAQYGISISNSFGTIMRDNRIVNNTYNFGVSADTLEGYIQDVDTSNTVDGRPISYFVGATSPVVRGDSGYLAFVNSRDTSVAGLSITKVEQGVLLAGSSNIVVNGLIATETEQGASLFNSTGIVLDNGTFGGSDCKLGVRLQFSSDNTIRINRFSCGAGLEIQFSNSNHVDGNFISRPFPVFSSPSPPFDIGAFVFNSTDNTFTGNEIVDFGDGLELFQSPANTLDGNLFHPLHDMSRVNVAIVIQNSPDNTLKNNQVRSLLAGLTITSNYELCALFPVPCWRIEDYVQNIDTSNRIDGKPVYYLVGGQDLTLNGPTGYLAIVNSTRIKVQGVSLSYSGDGIQIISSNNITVENSNVSQTGPGINSISSTELTIKNNRFSRLLDLAREIVIRDSRVGIIANNDIRPIEGRTGIELYNSTGFTIEGNLVTEYLRSYLGSFDGGLLLFKSNDNLVLNNTFLGEVIPSPSPYSSPHGVMIYQSQGNMLVCNTIARNKLGFEGSARNILYQNNFVNNTIQASGTGNSWNNTAGQGNYWSDYRGQDTDGDGIGDTLLPHLGFDYYPLMKPCSSTNTPPIAIMSLYQPNATDVWASAIYSWDLQVPLSALQFRWDWNNDGVWDTPWSTNATMVHNYSQPGAYTVRLEVMDSGGLTATTTEQVTSYAHDVAVNRIAPSSLSVTQGATLIVYVQVRNTGAYFEHFNVTLYYDNNLISTQAVAGLGTGENKTLSFSWDTTSIPLGGHTLKAIASTVLGETDTSDNTVNGPSLTITPRDIAAPTWPTSSVLGDSQVSSTAIVLAWTSATDDVAVTGYRVYENGQLVATVSGLTLTYAVTGLKPGTSYTFKVEAFDGAGNTSNTGPSITITTPALAHTQTPFLTQYEYPLAIVIIAAVVGSAIIVRIIRRKRSMHNL